MRMIPLLAAALALCSCDSSVGGRLNGDRYREDQKERQVEIDRAAAEEREEKRFETWVREKAIEVPVYGATRPDRPFLEMGLISVPTSDDAEATQLRLQVAVLRKDGDAAIVTGHHRQDVPLYWPNGNISQIITRDFTDAVAIQWKEGRPVRPARSAIQ